MKYSHLLSVLFISFVASSVGFAAEIIFMYGGTEQGRGTVETVMSTPASGLYDRFPDELTIMGKIKSVSARRTEVKPGVSYTFSIPMTEIKNKGIDPLNLAKTLKYDNQIELQCLSSKINGVIECKTWSFKL